MTGVIDQGHRIGIGIGWQRSHKVAQSGPHRPEVGIGMEGNGETEISEQPRHRGGVVHRIGKSARMGIGVVAENERAPGSRFETKGRRGHESGEQGE